MTGVFEQELTVSKSSIDGNGHVNNLAYLRWLLDVAEAHAVAVGGEDVVESLGATWFVRAHRIEYLRPAFLDDALIIRTWVASVKRVRSTRKYQIMRGDEMLVRAETDWVFVDAETGKPQVIPQDVLDCFVIVADQ